jgi:hypothetical protein
MESILQGYNLYSIQRFLNLQLSGTGNKDELAQKVPRKTFNEQSGIGPEGGDLHLNDRPGRKGGKVPAGNKTKDHPGIGVEAFREGKNFRE